MRLAEFILSNMEPILAEWEIFARAVHAGAMMDPLALRDHAEVILRATARDMVSPQSGAEQSSKSKGNEQRSTHSDRLNGASEEHAVGRVASGFNLIEVVSEYRALRASVLRLWRESLPTSDLDDIADITRFNECIDQSLTEAVAAYTRRLDESGQMFLAILGHDLRTPLFVVRVAAEALRLRPNLDSDAQEAATMIARSSAEMSKMTLDLLDFATSRLSRGLPVSPKPMDVEQLCREIIAEFRTAHPSRPLRLVREGDMKIDCDSARLRQAISNLIGNAVQHGRENTPIDVSIHCEANGNGKKNEESGTVLISVHNEGNPIPSDVLPNIFNPMVRGSVPAESRREGSVGLGLFITSEIAKSHGGNVHVSSTAEAGTTFTLRLPRRCAERD